MVVFDPVSLFSWAVTCLLLGIPIVYYWISKSRELKLDSVLATQKSVLIMVFPSNLGLLKKVLQIPDNKPHGVNKYGVKKIYFLKPKGLPVEEDLRSAMVKLLEAYDITIEMIKINTLENPKEVQYEIEKILSTVKDYKDNCAINITPGTKTSSIFLYEVARQNGIEVHYLSSRYNKENQPVDGTENIYRLEHEYVKKREG